MNVSEKTRKSKGRFVDMKGKLVRIGLLSVALALVGTMVFSVAAFAKGPGPGGPGNANAPRLAYGLGIRGAWGGPANSLVATAAEVLDMEVVDLVAELQAGNTIAQIAEEKGVALDVIVDAFVAEREATLAELVAAGRLTPEQADAMLATMKANILERLSAPFTPRGSGAGLGFVDADGDGICDYWAGGLGAGMGLGFVDADGDGVCDYYAGRLAAGIGLGFVDADGDGICDYYAGGRGGRWNR